MTSTKRRACLLVWAPLLALITIPTACDTLNNPLEVEPASRIPAGALETSGNALLLSDGAIADFECAFGA